MYSGLAQARPELYLLTVADIGILIKELKFQYGPNVTCLHMISFIRLSYFSHVMLKYWEELGTRQHNNCGIHIGTLIHFTLPYSVQYKPLLRL